MVPADESNSTAAGKETVLGVKEALSHIRDQQVPRQALLTAAIGTSIVALLVVELLTGLALASTYTPSTTDAWGSVYYLQEEMAMGWFVRALHYHGASVLLVLVVLHLTFLLFTASYRRPFRVEWFVTVLLTVFIMGFGITGYVLPWDQQGFWANQTELNIMDTVPGGEWIRQILAGGQSTGNQTLTRFYMLHTMLLPAALLLLLWIRGRMRYRVGVPASRPSPSHSNWPTQIFWSLLVAAFALTALVLLALTIGVTLDAPADPSSVYQGRPKWYFLWLFKLLQLFDGSAAILATVVFPMVALGFLLSVPWLDPKATKVGRPSRRVWMPFVLLLVLIGALTAAAISEDLENESYQTARTEAAEQARRALDGAKSGGINPAGKVILYEGYRLFESKGCKSCHTRKAEKSQGPLLAGYGSLDRITRFLVNPNHDDFFGLTPFAGQMDPFSEYSTDEADLQAVAAWLSTLASSNASGGPLVRRGFTFFKESECIDCHNSPTTSHDFAACAPGEDCGNDRYRPGLEGPDLDGYLGYEWTRALIREAGHKRFFGGGLDAESAGRTMPSYKDLSSTDLDLLTQWLLAGAPGAD